MAATAVQLRRVFRADRDAPASARRAVSALGAEMDEETAFRLELLVTELVTNSVVHAETSEVGLHLQAGPNVVHVTVADEGPGFDPAAAHNGGYGLLLLAQLADRWGADTRPGRNAVWFVVRRTHKSGAATAALHYAGRFAAGLLGRSRPTAPDPYLD